jgi:hypothetical protein
MIQFLLYLILISFFKVSDFIGNGAGEKGGTLCPQSDIPISVYSIKI